MARGNALSTVSSVPADEESEPVLFKAWAKLNKDIQLAVLTLKPGPEIRYLVDNYYIMQENRKRDDNQILSLTNAKEPASVIGWLGSSSYYLENEIKKALNLWAENDPLCRWMMSNIGIKGVLASGFRAHIDMDRVQTAGDVWRFAGLDPTSKWIGRQKAKAAVSELLEEHGKKNLDAVIKPLAERLCLTEETFRRYIAMYHKEGKLKREHIEKAGARCPWNARLKTLCWKLGESFVKVSNKPGDYYGHLYAAKHAELEKDNEAGKFAKAAAEVLAAVPNHKQKAIYATGKLSDGHVHSRAKRFAVKVFLSHLVEVGLILAGRPIVAPFAIARLGHAHKLEVPHMDVVKAELAKLGMKAPAKATAKASKKNIEPAAPATECAAS